MPGSSYSPTSRTKPHFSRSMRRKQNCSEAEPRSPSLADCGDHMGFPLYPGHLDRAVHQIDAMMRRAQTVLFLVVILGTSLLLKAQNTGSVQYYYDDAGRLTTVVDPSGNIATYHYDAVGNLISITRSALPGSNGLAILSFTPQQGPAGQTVTIQGQGFSTTASSDAVQFNSVAATVAAATTTTLTVTVPAGATTGPISVTVGGVTSTSAGNFAVTSLVSIGVAPVASVIGAGAIQQFRAVGTFSNGTTGDLTASVLWTSSNTSIATISNASGSHGLATGGATSGTTTITAASGSISGSTTLVVGTLSSLSVLPQNPNILGGATQKFTATGTFSNGSQQDLTNLVTWTSGTPTVATISNTAGSQGLVSAAAAGTTEIRATIGSISASSLLVVSVLSTVNIFTSSILVGQVQQFTATAQFSPGSTQSVTASATWSSSDTSVATISNSPGTQGVAVGVKGGTTNICASYTIASITRQGCSQVAVLPVLQAINVTPANGSLPKGESQQFTATGTYNDRSTQDLTSSVIWSSSNPDFATFPQTAGLATAVGIGTATITATSGSISGSTTLTVTAPVPVSVIVSPAYTGVVLGGTLQFRASQVLSDGTLGSELTATANWSSSDSNVAAISNATGSQGLASGVSPGVVTIGAASGTFNGSATLIVGSSSGSNIPRFAFTPNSGDDTISIYAVDAATGQLRANGYVAEQSGSKPVAVALDPTGKFLFVANSGTNTVGAYTVNPSNGTLTAIAGSPFAAGTSPNAIVVDPTANFVYLVNSGDNTVSGFAFDPTSGALTSVGSSFTVGANPNSVAIDSTGKFLYVTNSTDGTISAFTIDSASGLLTQIVGSAFPAGSNPQGMTIDPSNTVLLVANGPASGGGPSSELLRPRPDVGRAKTTGRSTVVTPRIVHTGLLGDKMEMHSAEGPGPSLAAFEGPAFPQSGTIGTGTGVSVFAIDLTTGALAPVSNSPFATTGSAPFSVAVDPSSKFVFALDASGGGLSMFYLDPSTGALTLLSPSAYATNFSPTSVSVDPSGLFVYVTGGLSNYITSFGISPTSGTLIPLGTLPARSAPAGLAISKGTAAVQYVPQYAYIAASGGTGGTAGSNNVFGYSIDSLAGSLTALSGSPVVEGFSPEFAATDPFRSFLYIANHCSDTSCSATTGSVSAYDIASTTGALSAVAGSPFPAGTAPASAVVDPSGQFAYVANSKDFTISGYTINSTTGALTAIAGSPFSVGTPSGASDQVVALATEPTGRYLFALTGCADGSCAVGIAVFSINPLSGVLLTPPPVFPFSKGVIPSSIAVEARGEFLFVTDAASGNVLEFSNASTGAPSALSNPQVPAGSNPVATLASPEGSVLYVVNGGSNSISAYSIALGSGTLTPVPGSPFTVGTNPVSASVDASGKFLYVVNQGDGTVSAFTIDSGTGALTPISGSPFPAGTLPISITTTAKTQ
jgi:YD repeat-containing protein